MRQFLCAAILALSATATAAKAPKPKAPPPAKAARPAKAEPPKIRKDVLFVQGPLGTLETALLDAKGRIAVTGNTDGLVQIWDVASGRELQRLRDVRQALSITKDGKRVFVAGPKTIEVVDVATGGRTAVYATDADLPAGVTISPDAKFVAAVEGGAVVVRDTKKKKEIVRAPGVDATKLAFFGKSLVATDNAAIDVLAGPKLKAAVQLAGVQVPEITGVSPDGSLVAHAIDGRLDLYKVGAKKPIKVPAAIGPSVRGVVFLDGKRVAVSSAPSDVAPPVIEVFLLPTGKRVLGPLSGGAAGSVLVGVSGDAKVGLAKSPGTPSDGLELWDLVQGRKLDRFLAPPSWVRSIAFTPDGSEMFLGFGGSTPRVFPTDGSSPPRAITGGTPAQYSGRLALSADGSTLVASLTGSIAVVKLPSLEATLLPVEEGAKLEAISVFKGEVAASAAGGDLHFLDLATKAVQHRPAAHDGAIRALRFLRDGRLVTLGGSSGAIWDAATFANAGAWAPGSKATAAGLAAHPDGKLFATATSDGKLAVFSASSLKQVAAQPLASTGSAVAFSLDGTMLAGGDDKGGVLLVNPSATPKVRAFKAHDGIVRAIAFAPGANVLATAGGDGLVKIWRTDNLALVASIEIVRESDWAVVAADGRCETSDESLLYVREGATIRGRPQDIAARKVAGLLGKTLGQLVVRKPAAPPPAPAPPPPPPPPPAPAVVDAAPPPAPVVEVAPPPPPPPPPPPVVEVAPPPPPPPVVEVAPPPPPPPPPPVVEVAPPPPPPPPVVEVAPPPPPPVVEAPPAPLPPPPPVLTQISGALSVQTGHRHPVRALAFASGGSLLVSGGGPDADEELERGELSVWDVASRRQLRALGARRTVTALASSGSTFGALVADEGHIELIDAGTGVSAGALTSERALGTSFSLCGEGNEAVAVQGASVAVWSVADRRIVRTIRPKDARSGSGREAGVVACSAKGGLVAFAQGTAVQLLDLAKGTVRKALGDVSSNVQALAFDAGGKRLVVGDASGLIALFDVVAGKRVLALRAHPSALSDAIASVAITPDGQLIAAGGETLVQVDLRAKVPAAKDVPTKLGDVRSLAYSPDGQTLAVGGASGLIELLQTTNGSTRGLLAREAHAVSRLAASAVGPAVALGVEGDGAGVRIWDPPTGREMAVFPGLPAKDVKVVMGASGTTVVAADAQKVSAWAVAGGRQLATFQPEETAREGSGSIMSLAISADGRSVVLGVERTRSGEEAVVYVLDGDTLKLRHRLTPHAVLVPAVAMTDDGTLAVAALGDQPSQVCAWQASTGDQVACLDAPYSPRALVAVPGSRVVAVGSPSFKAVRLLNLATGKPERADIEGVGAVTTIGVSRDGATLAVGDVTGAVSLVDVKTGAVSKAFAPLGAPATSVTFLTPTRLAVTTVGGPLRVLDATTGATITSAWPVATNDWLATGGDGTWFSSSPWRRGSAGGEPAKRSLKALSGFGDASAWPLARFEDRRAERAKGVEDGSGLTPPVIATPSRDCLGADRDGLREYVCSGARVIVGSVEGPNAKAALPFAAKALRRLLPRGGVLTTRPPGKTWLDLRPPSLEGFLTMPKAKETAAHGIVSVVRSEGTTHRAVLCLEELGTAPEGVICRRVVAALAKSADLPAALPGAR